MAPRGRAPNGNKDVGPRPATRSTVKAHPAPTEEKPSKTCKGKGKPKNAKGAPSRAVVEDEEEDIPPPAAGGLTVYVHPR